MEYLNPMDFVYKSFLENQEECLKKKLLEVGIEESVEYLTSRRFPKLTRERRGGWEYWYYNDGSADGLLVISFSEPRVEQDGNTLTVKFDIR